jgi:hypothetical protein
MVASMPVSIGGGLRYTSLKGRSGWGRTVVIVSASSTVLAILMAAGWISTKL